MFAVACVVPICYKGAVVFRELVERNRSYRRFAQDPVGREVLLDLVDLARKTASGGNKQPLKYRLSCDPATNENVFATLSWAASLGDWDGPAVGERPTAYIVVLGDTSVSKGFGCDQGIACQTILLGAVEKGLGGCMLGSVQRDRLREALSIDGRFEILLVVALGVPGEKVVLEDVGDDGVTTYYRDAESTHHVPKRTVSQLVVA
jgi:nitroreductase